MTSAQAGSSGTALTFAQIMRTSIVQPIYSSTVKFPATVIFPSAVAAALGLPDVNRVVIPNRLMPLPKALFDWLRSDSRFKDWFAN